MDRCHGDLLAEAIQISRCRVAVPVGGHTVRHESVADGVHHGRSCAAARYHRLLLLEAPLVKPVIGLSCSTLVLAGDAGGAALRAGPFLCGLRPARRGGCPCCCPTWIPRLCRPTSAASMALCSAVDWMLIPSTTARTRCPPSVKSMRGGIASRWAWPPGPSTWACPCSPSAAGSRSSTWREAAPLVQDIGSTVKDPVRHTQKAVQQGHLRPPGCWWSRDPASTRSRDLPRSASTPSTTRPASSSPRVSASRRAPLMG